MELGVLIDILIKAALSGASLAIGVYMGARLTPKAMRKEMEDWMEQSELFQGIKKLVKEQELIEKATKFFEEATVLVSSPEAKNFFKNVTKLMKDLGDPQKKRLSMPEKKRSKNL